MTDYYAVIFSSSRHDEDKGYAEMAEKMELLARKQNGFIDMESCGNADSAITISYWKDKAAIKNWRENIAHQAAQKAGKEKWYKQYKIRICFVEKEYEFQSQQS